jgi:hypothetical protein
LDQLHYLRCLFIVLVPQTQARRPQSADKFLELTLRL